MTGHQQDRALEAVRRVRTVREQDSRYGLTVSLTSEQDRALEAEAAHQRRAQAPQFGTGSVADFRSHLGRMSGLVALEHRATARAAASRVVAEEARNRWQHDRQQVRVVDLLLERRAAERAQERARREQAQLDDLATQGWLRNRAAEAHSIDQPQDRQQGVST